MELALKNITKRYGSLTANDRISLTVRPGEIHCLLGENGAGKTTLMNVLYGLSRADEGEIFVDGKQANFESPNDAISAGIGMVHQHFMLIPVFTVTENVVLGAEPVERFDRLNKNKGRDIVRKLSADFGMELDPDALVEELPVGIQQRVEIVKILYRSADVLIFDEPTAVLTPQEVEEFFGIIRSLKAAGKAILFITHKLNEVIEVADWITVLRHGKVVGETKADDMRSSDLAAMMVGRPIQLEVDKMPAQPGSPILKISNLGAKSLGGEGLLADINLTVRSGEIVGIAGVHGNGQTELVEVIAGLRSPSGGEVHFHGDNITNNSPRDRHRRGLAHIPEDRHAAGVASDLSIAENLVLDSYYEPRFTRFGSIIWDKVAEVANELVERFDIRTNDIDLPVKSLSGGNTQKVVIARELSREVQLILAAQPTRGVDVGSIEYIHSRLVEERDRGVGVLLVSTELDEILGLSDRILVMFDGRIVAEFAGENADRTEIGLAMAGMNAEHAAPELVSGTEVPK